MSQKVIRLGRYRYQSHPLVGEKPPDCAGLCLLYYAHPLEQLQDPPVSFTLIIPKHPGYVKSNQHLEAGKRESTPSENLQNYNVGCIFFLSLPWEKRKVVFFHSSGPSCQEGSMPREHVIVHTSLLFSVVPGLAV